MTSSSPAPTRSNWFEFQGHWFNAHAVEAVEYAKSSVGVRVYLTHHIVVVPVAADYYSPVQKFIDKLTEAQALRSCTKEDANAELDRIRAQEGWLEPL